MDIETLIKESKAETIIDIINIKTESGKAQFLKQLRLYSSHIPSLKRRQDSVLTIRELITNNKEIDNSFNETFTKINEIESKLQTFFSESNVEKDSFEQLTFSSWAWSQILNTIPFLLLCLSYFKLYIVPALAILTPIFMLIMPYITLRFWFNIPMTMEQYIDTILKMVGVQDGELFTPKNILQGCLTLFSLGQSIYQPIQNAIHLRSINKELIEKGEAIEELAESIDKIRNLLPEKIRLQNPLEDVLLAEGDYHRNFAITWDNIFRLHIALQTIGDIEVVYRLAKYENLQKVIFQKRDLPCLAIRGGIDPFLSAETRIPFSLTFTDNMSTHGILTGPNRGGKSSVLRSTLLSVLFAQTFGLAFLEKTEGARFHLRPFDWIATGLRLEDRPGKKSLFESEVEFASEILQRSNVKINQVGLVLFDELFHSTNPPDGARTASVFLKELWTRKNVVSFISTHVFSLAKSAPKSIQKLCVPAYINNKNNNENNIEFTYTLTNGVCEVSSVDLILKEKGLLKTA